METVKIGMILVWGREPEAQGIWEIFQLQELSLAQQNERKGGRRPGLPSKTKSLYLDKKLVKWVENEATRQSQIEQRKVYFKDVVSDALRHFATDDRDPYVKMSVVRKVLADKMAGKEIISQEHSDHIEVMAQNSYKLLVMMHSFPLTFVRDNPEWQQACAERENELAEHLRLFWGYSDAAEARKVVGDLLREELAKQDNEVEQSVQEQLQSFREKRKPRGSQLFRLLNLFRRRR